jgi:hypothetical protein
MVITIWELCTFYTVILDMAIFTNLTALSSQVKLYYDRRLVGQNVLVSGPHLGPATSLFSFFL